MELLESDPEEDNEKEDDSAAAEIEIEGETEGLPEEWCEQFQSICVDKQPGQLESSHKSQEEQELGGRKGKKKKWGPVVPERRSTRLKGCGPVLEKAQFLKFKNNLPPKEGKTSLNKSSGNISVKDLVSVASDIGLAVGNENVDGSIVVENVIRIEQNRNSSF